jgi:hypothetical protein
MKSLARTSVAKAVTAALVIAAVPAWSQSIQTGGDIHTDGNVDAVSFTGDGSGLFGVATDSELASHQGNPSAHHVPTVDTTCDAVACDGASFTGVDADRLDGLDSVAFAQESDLQHVETILLALQAQVNALGLAPVEDSGLKGCWDEEGVSRPCAGTGEDGEFQAGVSWPTPRFTDNGDGTVTDNLTGLIWLKDANCPGETKTWQQALDWVENPLNSGGTACSDYAAGTFTDWRLPNLRELQSLVAYGYYGPALPNTAGTGQLVEGDPFTGVQSLFYWSSTTDVHSTNEAWGVHMVKGEVNDGFKFLDVYVWPVRGGQ